MLDITSDLVLAKANSDRFSEPLKERFVLEITSCTLAVEELGAVAISACVLLFAMAVPFVGATGRLETALWSFVWLEDGTEEEASIKGPISSSGSGSVRRDSTEAREAMDGASDKVGEGATATAIHGSNADATEGARDKDGAGAPGAKGGWKASIEPSAVEPKRLLVSGKSLNSLWSRVQVPLPELFKSLAVPQFPSS